MASHDPKDIWRPSSRSAVGPKPEYSREAIVLTAINVADAEGLAAVSIRRVASEIGSGAASLYRYVRSREELVELMIDAVSSEYDLGPSKDSAHGQLLALAFQGRSIMHRHQWLAPLLLTSPGLGPNALNYLEHALSALKPVPMPGTEKLQTVAMLTAMTSAFVQSELAAGAGLRESRSNVKERAEYLAEEARSGRYPELSNVLNDLGMGESAEETFRRIIATFLAGAGVLQAE